MNEYKEKIQAFSLPRFNEIPNIDLYMDQLLVYLEKVLSILSIEQNENLITTSMVNNYVKQGALPPTIKKRYSREHVAYLIVIGILKQVYSITEISNLISVQNASFDIETAYNYMCQELENILKTTFDNQPIASDSAISCQKERLLVRNSMIAFAHKLYTHRLCQELLHTTNNKI